MALDSAKEALDVVNRAMQHGDDKYGTNAWIENPKISDPLANIEEHLAAAQRHLDRRKRGEMIDESGFPAMAHVAARALMALQWEIKMFEIESAAIDAGG